ncbi:hypothetical protein FISHEDRAFT_76244 [Fistulina hepatica ATCC 64428]|uniref:Uncharacterized protein n=1 Tax=Fistulina hepatica ATCC 64428 TaxID=1128425 RepID=A0A0D7A4M3_9AGAR|nr:hypothetical protein FISHEDRAFT_76244 [Fistulina hepatica ATCC 64428]
MADESRFHSERGGQQELSDLADTAAPGEEQRGRAYIHLLPTELILHIFCFISLPRSLQMKGRCEAVILPYTAERRLDAVCRRWREIIQDSDLFCPGIAIGVMALSNIFLTIGRLPKQLLTFGSSRFWVSCHFSCMPTSRKIYEDSVAAFSHAVIRMVDSASRWVEADLTMPHTFVHLLETGDFTSLEALRLNLSGRGRDADDFETECQWSIRTPNLRRLHLVNGEFGDLDFPCANLELPWTQLRTLVVEGIDLTTRYFQRLQICTSLRALSFINCYIDENLEDSCTFPSVKELSVAPRDRHASNLFRHLILPSLTTLTTSLNFLAETLAVPVQLSGFVINSSCNIKHAQIVCSGRSMYELNVVVEILNVLPSLESLELIFESLDVDFDEFRSFLHSLSACDPDAHEETAAVNNTTTVVPRLVQLTLRIPFLHDENGLARMVSSREKCHLRIFHLYLGEGELSVTGQEMFSRLINKNIDVLIVRPKSRYSRPKCLSTTKAVSSSSPLKWFVPELGPLFGFEWTL